MNVEDLLKLSEEHYSRSKDMITDVIDSGVTIVYGEAGVGKTISVIKNLNRHNIIPLMVDFDGNDRDISDVKVNKVPCRIFLDNFEAQRESDYKVTEQKIIDKFNSTIKEHTDKDLQYGKITYDKYKDNIVMSYDFIKENELLSEEHLKFAEKIILDEDNNAPREEHITNEVIIIDTYATAMFYFDSDILLFDAFLKKLKARNNNIVLIAHAKGERNKDIDVDSTFANAQDAKLRLERSQNRTKDSTFTLFVEKLRGNGGLQKIDNWER